MTAILHNGQRVEIPRITDKQLRGAAPSKVQKDPATGLIQMFNQSRTMRYQHLPDYNPSESDEDIRRKLDERFEILGIMTEDVIAGRVRAMVASGPGGVGKTFTIDQKLKEWDPEGDKHTSSHGYMTKVGLLRMLWKHRAHDDVIKLDDIDSIFSDENSLSFLKAACDTTKTRIITYASEATLIDEDTGERIPKHFEFHGRMLYITNLDMDQMIDKDNKFSKHMEAFVTRSMYVDLMMRTKRDYLVRVFQIAEQGLFDQIDGGLTQEEEDDVLTFIDKYYKQLRECSLRMAIKIGGIRKGADPEAKISWERKALLTCCRGVL